MNAIPVAQCNCQCAEIKICSVEAPISSVCIHYVPIPRQLATMEHIKADYIVHVGCECS
jgi:hypothetical protein